MKTRTVRYNYRAYPTAPQKQWLSGLFGAARSVYNTFIWEREKLYKQGLHTTETFNETVTRLTTHRALPQDKQWLKNYPAWTTQEAALRAKKAYQAYFDGLTGKRKSKVGKPKYKSKKNRVGQAVFCKGQIRTFTKLNKKYSAVTLQKTGREDLILKYRDSRPLASSPSSVTLKKDNLGQYWLSFVVEEEIPETKIAGTAVGIDLGLIDLVAVTSTSGERYKVSAPKFYRKAEKKLKRLHKNHSRKKKGSKNQEKARLALAKQYKKTLNQRKDFHQKLALKLASENQAVCLEDLNISGMKQSRLAKSVSDAGWGILVQGIQNQAQKHGAKVLQCGRFTATTQVCSYCWVSSGKKSLQMRQWTCENCKTVLDRDFNACVNILLAARHADTLNDCGPDVRRELARAVGHEAVTPALANSLN